MAKTLWLPGATKVKGPHEKGGTLAGGPPRLVHHITWDALGPKGQRPPFMNVAKYLVGMGYEPTVMIDPILGTAVQFLPFNRSAYALQNKRGGVETNRMGDACIQVEWFFTPGCVVNGVKYMTLLDTPMLGLPALLDVAKEYGIPAVWPAGVPRSIGASRSSTTWKEKAGHYGHCHVPENTHTDPGPMSLHIEKSTTPTESKEDDIVATAAELQKMLDNAVEQITGGIRQRNKDNSVIDPDNRHVSAADVLTGVEKQGDRTVAAIKEMSDAVQQSLEAINEGLSNLSVTITEALTTLAQNTPETPTT